MKITEEYTDYNVDFIGVESARYIGDYAIRVYFTDGVNRLVDFKPFLEASLHPSGYICMRLSLRNIRLLMVISTGTTMI
ncbi:MAG: hypothetical protein NT040_04430 [Bacteroidetes bacterium]|nr:hypothetical protein [Bacteroidota bacterium]